MTKVARKNVREAVAKCLEDMLNGGRYSKSKEATEHMTEIMNQIRTGTADDGAWADAMNQLLDVVEEVYPEKQNTEEGKENDA